MPTVSVVIPCYNLGRHVGEAIQSTLDQTHPDLEVIVVDDGSTDDTAKVVGGFDDRRVSYLKQRNQGPAAARNTGIQAARGEYLVFLDADDVLFPLMVQTQLAALSSDAALGLVGGGYQHIDEDGHLLRQVESWKCGHSLTLRDWLLGCPLVVHAVLVRRHWVEAVNGFDVRIVGAEDYDLWLRLAAAGCPMAWTEAIVCSYRFRPVSIMRHVERQTLETRKALDHFFADPEQARRWQDLRPRAYAANHLIAAAREYGAGEIELAQRDVQRAVELVPELVASGEVLESLLKAGTSLQVTSNQAAYTETVLASLPASIGDVAALRRKAQARICYTQLLEARRRGDLPEARRQLVELVRNDGSWLRNRGVWSVGTDVVLGLRIADLFRRCMKVAP